MLATHLGDRSVVLRELMPQDLKFEMERLKQDEAVAAARLFASVVGKAHGRQMDQKAREAWAKELGQSRIEDARCSVLALEQRCRAGCDA